MGHLSFTYDTESRLHLADSVLLLQSDFEVFAYTVIEYLYTMVLTELLNRTQHPYCGHWCLFKCTT